MTALIQTATQQGSSKWLRAGWRTLWHDPLLACSVTLLIAGALSAPALLPPASGALAWLAPVMVLLLGWSILMPLAWRHQPALAGRSGWLRWCAALPYLLAMALLTQGLNQFVDAMPATSPFLPGKTLLIAVLFLPCWLFAPVLIVLDNARVLEACFTAYRLFWRNLGSVLCNQGALLIIWLGLPLMLSAALTHSDSSLLQAAAPYLASLCNALFFVLLQASNYETWRDRCGAP